MNNTLHISDLDGTLLTPRAALNGEMRMLDVVDTTVGRIAEISIRPAALADAPACAEIHCRGWEAAYADLIPAGAIAERRARRHTQWQANLSRDGHEIYVSVLEGNIVGFLGLGLPRDKDLPETYYEVCGIYLDPDYYRRGIGRKLMAFAEEQARAKGKTAMMLWVFQDNAPSRRFYEACGYHPDGRTNIVEYGRPLVSMRYVKELL